MAPSPTADATRFIESRRTSPAANTPGTLVSSTNGGRVNGQRRSTGPGHQIGAGDHETSLVTGNLFAEPFRAR